MRLPGCPGLAECHAQGTVNSGFLFHTSDIGDGSAIRSPCSRNQSICLKKASGESRGPCWPLGKDLMHLGKGPQRAQPCMQEGEAFHLPGRVKFVGEVFCTAGAACPVPATSSGPPGRWGHTGLGQKSPYLPSTQSDMQNQHRPWSHGIPALETLWGQGGLALPTQTLLGSQA